MNLYQFSSNYAPGAKNGPATGVTLAYITCSEYGHVAYKIKGNEAYNNMRSILPLHTPLTPWVGSKVRKTAKIRNQCKKVIFFFSENSHVAYQINRNKAKNTMHANILPYYTPTNPDWVKSQNNIFLKVMLH